VTSIYGYTYYGRPHSEQTVFGEAPGPTPGAPLAQARKRIGELIGLTPDEMAERFEWRNLLDEWPGYGPGGGSAFPKNAARHRARYELVHHRPLTMTTNRRFIYLGKRVAEAFHFDEQWLTWRNDQAICPHPSGLNRWWNEPANLERAREFWRALL